MPPRRLKDWFWFTVLPDRDVSVDERARHPQRREDQARRRLREETQVLGQPRGPDTTLRMAPQDVCRVVALAGFALTAVVDVGPYHYGAVFRRAESI